MNDYQHNRPRLEKNGPKRECIRCGTCCKKGGPSLHAQDKWLVEEGLIKARLLYTIRKGELVHNNVKQRLEPLTEEIIKIKGCGASWTCILLDTSENRCTIYDHRPVECRALKCWDTRELERIYEVNRLTRKDLMVNVAGLWDLIEDHEERCAYHRVEKFRQALGRAEKESELKKISEILHYDTRIRRLVVEKVGTDPAITDFVFGRSMADTLKLSVLPRDDAPPSPGVDRSLQTGIIDSRDYFP